MPSIKLTTIAEGPIILKRRTGFLIPSVTFCGLHLALWTTQNVSGGVASPVALRCKRRGCKPRRASVNKLESRLDTLNDRIDIGF